MTTSSANDQRRTGVAWRASLDTWPSLRVTVELAPWAWRLSWYRDAIDPCFFLTLGPLKIELWANRKPFALERFDGDA